MHCANVSAVQIRIDKDCNILKMKKEHPLQVEIPEIKWFAEDRGEILCQKQSGPTLKQSSSMNYALLYWINPPMK